MSDEIATHVLSAISSWDPRGEELIWSNERFDELARAVFTWQFEHNVPYQKYCIKTGHTPKSWSGYKNIPALPTDVFKAVDLTCALDMHTQDAVRIFHTSGTTQGKKGRHIFPSLHAYAASLRGPFARFCNPEGRRWRMLVLAPSPQDFLDSSLSYMLGELLSEHGDASSRFFITRHENGTWCLDLLALQKALDDACASNVPTFVLGTAFGFMALFDGTQTSWNLPAGSRLMETGGFKGKSREVSRDELYALFEKRLNIPWTHAVSEYSMTELSAQAYTDNLHAHTQGESKRREHVRFRTPPWARVDVVDPHTLKVLMPQPSIPARGLVRWTDLSNINSVLAVLTSDFGEVDADRGFSLMGRALGSELRGCSLTVEEMLDDSKA